MISSRLGQVISAQLKLDGFSFHPAMTASQVPGWDSLSHLAIITAVEAEYGIRFSTLEVIRLMTIGDLQSLVDRKTTGK
jgi:acyl carrier protein